MNEQFKMLSLQMRFEDIPESGIVSYIAGKKEKKDYWYNIYKFTEEQESKWQKWARAELRKIFPDEKTADKLFLELDMAYGFVRRYPKKGELF